MNEITKKESSKSLTLIEKMKLERSIKDKVLLVDISGSMSEYAYENKSKIDCVKQITKNLPESLIKFEFEDHCKEVKFISYPKNGTRLGRALFQLSQDIRKFKQIILITDGLPDDGDYAIEVKNQYKLNLHIIYVGPKPMPDFIKKITDSYEDIQMTNLGKVELIEEKIKGLLNA